MKKKIYTLAISMFVVGAIFTSCKTPAEKVEKSEEKVEKAQEDLDQAKIEYDEQYNQFMQESNEKITANDKLIADLKIYSKNKKKETKIKYDKTIADLEAKNQAMKEKIRNHKEEGNDKWESFKNEFNHDMDELGKSINDLGKDNVK